ncbi:hypothetical protein FRC07_012329 [Ceratobasidium sp. 392]|nr:hypothetical protein FRC07_012329 [Ceratobasidium sp. 392]
MQTASKFTFSYQPPPGGDISLRSNDGVVFCVHSLILRLASPRFESWFLANSQSAVYELSDDAESISLMLRFIYPPVFVDELPIELLGKGLHIGHKYEVGGIITAIDHIMSHSLNKDGLIHSNTIRAFCLATIFRLPKTRAATAEALRPGYYNFSDPNEVTSLANTHTNAAGLIGLVGAHGIHIRSLSDLLFSSGQTKILPDTPHRGDGIIMACRDCMDDERFEFEGYEIYKTSWFAYWSIIAFRALVSQPLGECDYLFQTPILDELLSTSGTCKACIVVTRTALNGGVFLQWAHKAKSVIAAALKEVECLHNL